MTFASRARAVLQPRAMQVCSACWHQNEQILRSQGLNEASVAEVWAAVAAYIRASLAQGRGVNLVGVCKLLQPRVKGSNSSNGLSIVLSDKLMNRFPNLQLGSGMSHYAAVREQVRGADDINQIRLAQSRPQLSRDTVQLILKNIISTITHLIELQQTFALDLGAGQLRFKAGRVVEFQPSSSSSAAFSPAAAEPVQQALGVTGVEGSCGKFKSSLTAGTLSQIGGLGRGSDGCKSTVSKVSRAPRSTAAAAPAAESADTVGQAPALATNANLPSSVTLSSSALLHDAAGSSSRYQSHSTQRGACELPSKPGSNPLTPDDVIQASRQAKAAALVNARVKPATFVLPVGAPEDQEEPRVPQGKGRPAAAVNPAHQQVLEAAAARHASAAAAEAAADAELMARNEALKKTLDAQAQVLRQQQVARKKQLADTLAQQIREKQTLGPSDAAAGALMLGKTAAQVSNLRLKQREEYRAALDEQLAVKASLQQHHRAEDTVWALAELHKVQQSVVAAAEASRNSRQQAAAAVRQQLDMQVMNNKHQQDM